MGCAGVLKDALAEVGVKKLSKIPYNQGRGHVIVSAEVEQGSLNKVAGVINKALTPHRERVKPGVSLELAAKLNKDTAAAALKALESVDGVDAKRSKVDLKRGAVAVRLTGDKPLTVAGIKAALKKAGVDASN